MLRTITAERSHRGDLRVWIDGVSLDPRPSQKVWNHSPDGFNAGYGGSGPAQLALGILLACGFSEDYATALHQSFKWAHLAKTEVAGDKWELQLDVEKWAEEERKGHPDRYARFEGEKVEESKKA